MRSIQLQLQQRASHEKRSKSHVNMSQSHGQVTPTPKALRVNTEIIFLGSWDPFQIFPDFLRKTRSFSRIPHETI